MACAPFCQYVACTASNAETRLEGADRGLVQLLPRNFPEGTYKNTKKSRITYVSAEIRTDHIPNISLQRHLLSQPVR
jgi:hypothetical protein